MSHDQGADALEGVPIQFRLERIQTYQWGTFEGICDVRIPRAGYLFVGPSGSGKSTLLDAHAALMTPPKWVDFNVAAREAEKSGRDRSLASYVRGAWAQQTGENGEHGVQYLRPGTTWSAIAETYADERGRVITLAQVLWVRGRSNVSTDIKRLYLVLERAFEVRELESFARSDFDVRKLKAELTGAFIRDEFSPYQERFRRLLGIDTERALRLLHKTQSAKNLGDLNQFLRSFMLDEPETFATADRLVSEFGELDAAHLAVVTARMQIDTLAPARASHHELERVQRDKNELDELDSGLGAYVETRREALLRERVVALRVELDAAEQEAQRIAGLAAGVLEHVQDMKGRRDGLGSGLAQLRGQLEQVEREAPQRAAKRELAVRACSGLGFGSPDTPQALVSAASEARARLAGARIDAAEREARKDALKDQRRRTQEEFEDVCKEVRALERQPSNIPSAMLELRDKIARATRLDPSELPFVGELIEVKKEAAPWRGAIERVLHGLALSILVEEQHLGGVSAYVNGQHLGQKVVYLRMVPHSSAGKVVGPLSLCRKLSYAQHAASAWLRDELAHGFDYECVDSVGMLRGAKGRAVTVEGLVKHGHSRHEKDDRRHVDDARRWVLGFSNHDKLRLFTDRAAELGAQLARLTDDIDAITREEEQRGAALLHCQTLANLTWTELDVASLVQQAEGLRQRIAEEVAARPELAALDAQIRAKEAEFKALDAARLKEAGRAHSLTGELSRLEKKLRDALERANILLTPQQQAGLDTRFAANARTLSLDSLDAVRADVQRALGIEARRLQEEATALRVAIEKAFAEFNRSWPTDSGGIDARLVSAPDYFAKLERLENDGLPRYEERFMRLLREQSDQNLVLLSTRLDHERGAIHERLELVNASLLSAPFNPGTHLVIEPSDRLLEEVRQFKRDLKQALSQSLGADQSYAEQRFKALRAIVKRLSSSESVDRTWRSTVLDVRQHVEFVARELDGSDVEVEIYRSGAGKSGGQRQKLAATCLAAALRYQLGGGERSLPSYATVVLDEAFDKADNEFTTMAMNIFKTFGFQMIVATPLKSVMTLEPFIGGACFVHIRDRKHSAALVIDYDETTRRLKLDDKHDGSETTLS